MSDWDAQRYIAEIDRERARLRKMVRSKKASILARRPANGDWSIVEHVRHLLFAEQAHLGGLLPGGFKWSAIGLGGNAGRRLTDVGTSQTRDIDEVFRAWDEVHKPIRRASKSGERDVERALWRNHRHLRTHISMIEKLLRKWDGRFDGRVSRS